MPEALKDQFDAAVVADLADRFAAATPSFDRPVFVAAVTTRLDDLELKARMDLVADEIVAAFGGDYPAALDAVLAVAGGDIEGFAAWPLCTVVERHGIDDPVRSLAAMPALTRRWSCEFAIRPFLDTEPDLALEHLGRWVHDDDEHVRRLVSEGTRPRLPWAPKVQRLLDDPGIGIDLLAELRHDPSEMVRRSVANHLNDVARAHPDRVVEVLSAWGDDPAVDPRMVRHALRTLVKDGHPGALAILGFTTDPAIDVARFSVSPDEVRLGDDIEMAASITSTGDTDQRLVVDFVVHHVGADGTARPKVFKWTTLELGPGESVELRKRRRVQTASTRRYHAGRHRVDLQVAGAEAATDGFTLLESSG